MFKYFFKSFFLLSSLFLFIPSFSVLANDNYNIESCNGCSQWSMRVKAEQQVEFDRKKVHVFNEVTGQLNAYWVEMDYENGHPISSVASADTIVAQRAQAAVQAANDVPEPQLPESISDDAWEFARNTSLQNRVRDWLNENADWKLKALAKAQTVSDLLRGKFQSQRFVVHLKSGGKIVFKSTSYIVDGDELLLDLEFLRAEDKEGNRVALTQADLNATFALSGGADGNASSMADTAVHLFGAVSVSYNFPPGGDSGSFSCTLAPDRVLHCTKVK